jgi:hypothetical protein
LLAEPLDIRDGQLHLSDRPGLGIELRADTLARFKMPNPLEIPDGLYSDMAFGRRHCLA